MNDDTKHLIDRVRYLETSFVSLNKLPMYKYITNSKANWWCLDV